MIDIDVNYFLGAVLHFFMISQVAISIVSMLTAWYSLAFCFAHIPYIFAFLENDNN